MNKCIKIKSKMLIKTIAIILVAIMILQLFPAIVFGIQQDVSQSINNIEENNIESNTIVNSNQGINNTYNQENNTNDNENQSINSTEQSNQETSNDEEINKENNIEEDNNKEENLTNEEQKISTENLKDSSEIIGEIIEKRTLNQKHFLQKDGNIITNIYPSNIHYEKDGL